MTDIGQKIASGLAAIIGLAVLAIIISARANTVSVVQAFFGGLSNLVGVAISPVTGQTVSGLTAGLPGGGWVGGTSNFAASGGSLGISGFSGGSGGSLNLSGLTSLFSSGGGGGGSLGGLGSLLGNSGGAGGIIDAGTF